MLFDRKDYSNQFLTEVYKNLLLPRLIEEKMLNLLRQGKVSKWFSGIGQEGIAVGAALALHPEEYILPLIRNLGVFTTRNIPLKQLFLQFQGKKAGFTKGRDRSFHFGTMEHRIVGMISHLGPQLAVASGIALWDKIKDSKKVTLVFSGDGATSEGDFHEALNIASVWDLPVIFIIENNGYGLSTTPKEQYRCQKLVDRALGYGMRGVRIEGNNVLEVYNTISSLAVELRRSPAPVFVEALTFRMRGHEEASGTKYVPKQLIQEWSLRDPVHTYESFLLSHGIISMEQREQWYAEIHSRIDAAWDESEDEPNIVPDTAEELNDIYKPFAAPVVFPVSGKVSEKRFINAISEALDTAMQKYPDLIIMGQDVAGYGGVFKITDGFMARYGADRVRNTPLCESAVIGTGMGYALRGGKAVVEMQFADFVTCGFNQIVNNLAKLHYRWGQNADVVVRMPTGGGVAAGPFHSQSTEAWFTHTPGLKVVYPANPFDAKGLLLAAIEDPNPVMFFEHKALYRAIHAEVPDEYFTLPIGKAKVEKEGTDVTIITYGMGVHWAMNEVARVSGYSCEVIDLRTLLPLDFETIFSSVRKTGKALVLHEDCLFGGIGGEIAARVAEHCFEQLDAPVVRVGSLDTPVPFAAPLEQNFLPVNRFREQLHKLLEY